MNIVIIVIMYMLVIMHVYSFMLKKYENMKSVSKFYEKNKRFIL